jgi:ribose transport system ATP-binding protein
MNPSLKVSNLSKAFSGHLALNDFNMTLLPGEIHALVGENGCGKSTLVKCLSGYFVPEPGARIEIAGTVLQPPFTPEKASTAGLRFVHQDLGLITQMKVMENLALGHGFETNAFGAIKWVTERKRANEILGRLDLAIDPDEKVTQLSMASRAMVALGRAIGTSARGVRVIILDEPSASLPMSEVQVLHDVIRRIAANGVSVLIVSHRMSEVFELADRVTAMRDGQHVGTFDTSSLTHDSLAEIIIGRRLIQQDFNEPVNISREVSDRIEISDVSGGIVSGLTLSLERGEIVGLAGLRGSGRSTAARLISGVQLRVDGTVKVNGKEVPPNEVAAAVKGGIAYVPEERKDQAVFPLMSVSENLLLPQMGKFSSFGVSLSKRSMKREAVRMIDQFDIRPPIPETVMGSLSGGNQQKVVLARWMSLDPKLMILDEPVQGVDIGAKHEIFEMIRSASEDGMAFIVVDSDIENLSKICHRICIMSEGEIVEQIHPPMVHDADEVSRRVLVDSASVLMPNRR